MGPGWFLLAHQEHGTPMETELYRDGQLMAVYDSTVASVIMLVWAVDSLACWLRPLGWLCRITVFGRQG